ncbi:hypothetical protein MCUN1_002471 [Malassezia cuniculi]|uniref:Altered inheritance of mitochondria protein 41 n=1 Tax=Malassezia cuniculi TaxID=948313 RepID=A0AAF0ERK7_9BASI|nr:hypothetical protein MCUN1_002471 [Malassezia cuniculi]
MLLARVAAARTLPAARIHAASVANAVRMSSQNSRPAPGPNPKDDEVLAQVKQSWKKARFAKDSDTANVLGGILNDLQYTQKMKQQPNQKPPSVIKTLQKNIKKRTDAAKVYRAAKPEPRIDLAEKEEREIALLQSFLPKE